MKTEIYFRVYRTIQLAPPAHRKQTVYRGLSWYRIQNLTTLSKTEAAATGAQSAKGERNFEEKRNCPLKGPTSGMEQTGVPVRRGDSSKTGGRPDHRVWGSRQTGTARGHVNGSDPGAAKPACLACRSIPWKNSAYYPVKGGASMRLPMRQAAAFRKRSAFTLVEILIVIIILGTLAAIVEPQMAY